MRNIHTLFFISMFLILFSGCAQTVPYKAMDPKEMKAVSQLAIELTELAKKDVPLIEPYMNVEFSNVDLADVSGYDNFFIQNIVIMEADLSADRFFSQRTLVESADKFGRIDLRDDRIALKVREPDSSEAQQISSSFKKYFSKSKLRRLSKTDRSAFQDAIRTYQQDNDLGSDGIFGKATAMSLAEEAPIVDIKGISSTIVYPEAPRHAIYIVPSRVVRQNQKHFDRGFDSIEMVKQNAIGPEGFASLAEAGAKFTVFVYFFDRVDPYYPLSVRLSTSKLKATGSAGQRWYADPLEWPVLVETFTLNKDPRTVLSSLYLSVCIENDQGNKCISSRKLQ